MKSGRVAEEISKSTQAHPECLPGVYTHGFCRGIFSLIVLFLISSFSCESARISENPIYFPNLYHLLEININICISEPFLTARKKRKRSRVAYWKALRKTMRRAHASLLIHYGYEKKKPFLGNWKHEIRKKKQRKTRDW